MNIVIAFGGPCHSGKSTLIKSIATRLGPGVVVITENIRDHVTDIDTVRLDPRSYFDLQEKIITDKIHKEDEASARNDGKVILVDRSLGDSLYYLTTYVNRSRLDDQRRRQMDLLVEKIRRACAKKRYDIVYIFEPITAVVEKDWMRPANLVDVQSYEHAMIKVLTLGLLNTARVIDVSAERDGEKIFRGIRASLQEISH